MATRKKVSKKKVEEKKPKVLTNSEMIRLELAGANGQNRKMELKCYRVELEKHKKELALLIANHTIKLREIADLEHKITAFDKMHKDKLADHLEFVEELKERLELDNEWGYDPDTGEIKE